VPLYPAHTKPSAGPADERERVRSYRCTSPLYGQHHAIVRCPHCGLVYACPRPSDKEVVGNYRVVTDPLYAREKQGRLMTFRRYVERIEETIGPAQDTRRCLDVGCYTGLFLEVAEDYGWEAWGVEPSQWAVEEGQGRGLNVLQGTLDEVSLPARSFDVLTFWDVIEHLPDPRAALTEAHRLLKSDGWLVVQTMDVESWPARLLGAHWPWFMEMHLTYFSPRTLARLLEQVGLTPVKRAGLGRYLQLHYLATRLEFLSTSLATGVQLALQRLRWTELPIWIRSPDLFTLFAQKREGEG
jgi:ubiquinone/menaquinone biosynthesis C-methylase UbiE